MRAQLVFGTEFGKVADMTREAAVKAMKAFLRIVCATASESHFFLGAERLRQWGKGQGILHSKWDIAQFEGLVCVTLLCHPCVL